MGITTKVGLMPFKTPNFVLTEPLTVERQDGFKETPKYALKDLGKETLSELCDEFRRDIFSKAGKQDPAKA